jgi:uncharacterized membrane protein YkgB
MPFPRNNTDTDRRKVVDHRTELSKDPSPARTGTDARFRSPTPAAKAGAVLEQAHRRHGLTLLRISLGIVLLWFALPKYHAGLSAVEELAIRTIDVLTLHLVTGDTARLLLAVLETAIGLGLLTGWFPRLTATALLGQLAGTLTPLVLFPSEMWTHPLVPSLEGQFILKNVVFVAAGTLLLTAPRPSSARARKGRR